MEIPFEEIDVFEVVKTLNCDKAPGLDGFSSKLVRRCSKQTL
jgi:hypothetical protein